MCNSSVLVITYDRAEWLKICQLSSLYVMLKRNNGCGKHLHSNKKTEHEKITFIWLHVSHLELLFLCWITTCSLLILNDAVKGLLLLSTFSTKAAAAEVRGKSALKIEGVYLIWITLIQVVCLQNEPLEESQGTLCKGNGEYRFNLWTSAKIPIRKASVGIASKMAAKQCQEVINVKHAFYIYKK